MDDMSSSWSAVLEGNSHCLCNVFCVFLSFYESEKWTGKCKEIVEYDGRDWQPWRFGCKSWHYS